MLKEGVDRSLGCGDNYLLYVILLFIIYIPLFTELRKAVRTSTWQKDLSKHVHDYDIENEVYDEEEDVYTKKSKTCGHEVQYEKM